MIITQRVYLTNDGRHVGEGDPDAAFLAYSAGTEVSDAVVQRLGLGAWARAGVLVRNPSVVIGPDTSGRMTMTSAGDTNIVGTIPPGHATASPAGVPAEVTDPVVNADGTHRGDVAVAPQPARTTTTPPAVKPARTAREV